MTMKEEIQDVAANIGEVADAIRSLNSITLPNGSEGSVMIGVAQALFQIGEAMTQISKDFTRYVDYATHDVDDYL